MSFSFGFGGDDIEGEGQDDDQDALADEISRARIFDSERPRTRSTSPRRHTFQELSLSLPSQISYNTLKISRQESAGSGPQDKVKKGGDPNDDLVAKIYRRSVFDIRAQLMAEANPWSTNVADSAETLLADLENGDLSSGSYEGGFKTWECALDLASLLIGPMSPLFKDEKLEQDWHVVELGAGSAIPSLAVLGEYLRRGKSIAKSADRGYLRLTLCDYNDDVLRLATAPNVLLNYVFLSGNPSIAPQQAAGVEDEGELDVEGLGGEVFTDDVMKEMRAGKISLGLCSGPWGERLVQHITNFSPHADLAPNLLIIASETIYSPSSIKAFSKTLITILERFGERDRNAKAWIAAKKVYFGVGGGVDEFEREISLLQGKCRVIFETKDTGVGRVVLEVTSFRQEH